MSTGAILTDASAYAQPTGYTHIYQDWDITASTYCSFYVVFAIGLLSGIMVYKNYVSKPIDFYSLEVQFCLFAIFEAFAFGLSGATHQVLSAYYSQGIIFSRHPFRPHSEWLGARMCALIFTPLASSAIAGVAFAYSRTATGWIRWAKVFGALIAIAELYLCFVNVDATGKISMYWGFACTLLGLVLCCKDGWKPAIFMIVGFAFRLLAYILLAFTPPGCWSPDDADSSCPYPSDFNQRAVFGVLNVGAVVFVYAGVVALLTKSSSYLPTSDDGSRRCCGM